MLSVNTPPHTHARTHARTHTLKHVYVLSSPGRPPETARSAQQSGVEPSARGPDQVQQVPVCGTSHLWPQSLRVDVRGPQADLRLQLHADQKWVPVQIMLTCRSEVGTGPCHACQKSARTGSASCWPEVSIGPDRTCQKSVLVQLHADQKWVPVQIMLARCQSVLVTQSATCWPEVGTGPDHNCQKSVSTSPASCWSEVGTGPDHDCLNSVSTSPASC